MPKQIESRFTKWEFSEDEILSASIFTDLNYKYIQNELAEITEVKMLISFNPDSNSPQQEFIGEHEYHRGYMAALTTLLNKHHDALETLHSKQTNQTEKDN